jgi:hypothetical protein
LCRGRQRERREDRGGRHHDGHESHFAHPEFLLVRDPRACLPVQPPRP